jgi:hypothetical protein
VTRGADAAWPTLDSSQVLDDTDYLVLSEGTQRYGPDVALPPGTQQKPVHGFIIRRLSDHHGIVLTHGPPFAYDPDTFTLR